MNILEQLKTMTTVVADTGDFRAIAQYKPTDATTNPTLLYKSAQIPECKPLLLEAIEWARQQSGDFVELCTDRFTIGVGKKITEVVPGRVSTEVDARLSFNAQAMISKAHRLIDLYAQLGVDKSRILIKLASTWEGIQAAKVLEREGIACNLTLLFGFEQAVACADVGVTLISPFVGRIYDWYQKRSPDEKITADKDPGVLSVKRIYNYYKKNGYQTIVMGASFRTTDQIIALAGCDNLTISPELLAQLTDMTGNLQRQLSSEKAQSVDLIKNLSEENFRWGLNENAMATEKLAEGIRQFAEHQLALEELISKAAQ